MKRLILLILLFAGLSCGDNTPYQPPFDQYKIYYRVDFKSGVCFAYLVNPSAVGAQIKAFTKVAKKDCERVLKR